MSELSGGNQQKVLFARALAGDPAVLLLHEPTRGVDVGAKFDIYTLIRERAAKGTAVIVVSSDLPELIGLADRIAILNAGRVTRILPTDDLTEAALLSACYQKED
jgi:ribose transport system ATP-binding protein